MKVKLFVFVAIASMLVMIGCSAAPDVRVSSNPPVEHKLKIEIITKDGQPVEAQLKDDDVVVKSMSVRKDGYELSNLSAVYGKKLYIKLFSGLSVADVTRVWSDMLIVNEEYGFGSGSEVHIFIDSPGGDAFAGLALADLIEMYQKEGIKFVAHGSGIIASAAVPIFAVCDETHATNATIFMVHEAALWKWPGRESASDIRAQGELMDLLQDLYLKKLVNNSNEFDAAGKRIDLDYWVLLEAKTSWFNVDKAVELGLLDYIDN